MGLLILLFNTSLIAQAPVTKIGINTLGFRTEKKTIIRWVLDDAKQWRYAIKKGFNIERAEGTSNKFIQLNKNVILPISAAQLSKYDSNSFVFEAMSFLLTGPKNEASRGEEDNKFYSVYFLRSSYETEAAVQSASAFVDTTIEKGKSYTYRVKIADTKVAQTLRKTIIGAEISLLPKSPNLNAIFGDRIAKFNWSIKDVGDFYFATILERSTDSLEFKRLGSPYVKILDKGESSEDAITLKTTDSIPNKIKFFYRLKGIHFSGLYGEPSNVVSGFGVPNLDSSQLSKSLESTKKSMTTIASTLPKSHNKMADRFEMDQSKMIYIFFNKLDKINK